MKSLSHPPADVWPGFVIRLRTRPAARYRMTWTGDDAQHLCFSKPKIATMRWRSGLGVGAGEGVLVVKHKWLQPMSLGFASRFKLTAAASSQWAVTHSTAACAWCINHHEKQGQSVVMLGRLIVYFLPRSSGLAHIQHVLPKTSIGELSIHCAVAIFLFKYTDLQKTKYLAQCLQPAGYCYFPLRLLCFEKKD